MQIWPRHTSPISLDSLTHFHRTRTNHTNDFDQASKLKMPTHRIRYVVAYKWSVIFFCVAQQTASKTHPKYVKIEDNSIVEIKFKEFFESFTAKRKHVQKITQKLITHRMQTVVDVVVVVVVVRVHNHIGTSNLTTNKQTFHCGVCAWACENKIIFA